MSKFRQFIQKWQAALLIILVSIFAYALLLPWMGFYIDDWTFTWTYQLYGQQGLLTYFSGNRPFLGLLYHVTMPLFQENILAWQLFGLTCRILLSLTFYWLMALLWPRRKTLTLFAGLLFAVYPGFLLQPIPIAFAHIWLVYLSFLLSNCFTILALRNPTKRVCFTAAAVLLSIYNVFCMEYFLPLEALRFILLFYLIAEPLPFFKRLGRAIKLWLPYLAVLAAVSVYRIFFYKAQTLIYPLKLLEAFKQSIGNGFAQLWHAFISALYQSTVYAWVQPIVVFSGQTLKNPKFIFLLAAMLVLFVLLFFVLFRALRNLKGSEESGFQISPLVFALFALLLAGIPFYITLLPVLAAETHSRFTMPFMLGVVLLLAFLLDLIPNRWLKIGLISLILAVSIGFHLYTENNYRKMTVENNDLMYQIWWRAPSLKPGTLVVTNEIDSSVYFTPSTLRTELNLVYPHDPKSSFGWQFAQDLIRETGTPVRPATAVHIPMFVSDFNGSTDSLVAFQISENGCARFVDANSTFFEDVIVDNGIQKVSNADNLLSDPTQSVTLDPTLIGAEPEHTWCYYFEKSDLALQLKDYETIVKNYHTVIDNNFRAFNGYEWFPFVEGLARAGDWQNAIELSGQIIAENPQNDSYQPILCQLLTKVKISTNSNDQAAPSLAAVGCSD
ncbi:MAG: hypothetical protein AB9897_04810 [Anaerolineaceae bacterium]